MIRIARNSAGLSKALWIPILWLFIAGSRPVSGWLGDGAADTTARYLEGSPLDRNIFIGLIIAALIVLARRGQRLGTVLRGNGPIILFLFYCGLSVLWSDFPDIAFKRWIRAVGDVAMVLVILTDPGGPTVAIKESLWRLIVLIIPVSIVFDFFRGLSGRGYHYGLTANKNMFGAISMVLGLAAVWHLLTIYRSQERRGRSRKLFVHGSITAMAAWCVVSSDSATSLACFLMGSFVIFVTDRWSFARKPAIVHLLTVSLAFLALYAAVLNPSAGLVSTLGKDPTLTGRTQVWKTVIQFTPSPLFGAGFESFWLGQRLKKLWTIFVWSPNQAHNGYIEVYLNLGWVGLICLLLIMMTGYRKVVKGFRKDRSTASLRLAYFVITVIYNITEAGFRMFNPIWIVFLLSIAIVFKTKRETPRLENPAPIPRNVESFGFNRPDFEPMPVHHEPGR